MDCGDPAPLQQGGLDYPATTYKNVVRYSCQLGFALKGPESRHCGSSGLWSRQPPSCVPVTCASPEPVPMGSLEDEGPWGAGQAAG